MMTQTKEQSHKGLRGAWVSVEGIEGGSKKKNHNHPVLWKHWLGSSTMSKGDRRSTQSMSLVSSRYSWRKLRRKRAHKWATESILHFNIARPHTAQIIKSFPTQCTLMILPQLTSGCSQRSSGGSWEVLHSPEKFPFYLDTMRTKFVCLGWVSKQGHLLPALVVKGCICLNYVINIFSSYYRKEHFL